MSAVEFAYDALARRTRAVGEAVLARLARQQRPVHEAELPRLLGGLPKTWPHALALAAALGLAEVDHQGLYRVPAAPAVSVERTLEALDIEREADEARRSAQAAKEAARAAQTPDERHRHQLDRNARNVARSRAGLTGPKLAAAAARAASSPPPVTGSEPVTEGAGHRAPVGDMPGDGRVSSASASAAVSQGYFQKPEAAEAAEKEVLPPDVAREPEAPAASPSFSVTEPVTGRSVAPAVEAWCRGADQSADQLTDEDRLALRRALDVVTVPELEAVARYTRGILFFATRPHTPAAVCGKPHKLAQYATEARAAVRPVSASRHTTPTPPPVAQGGDRAGPVPLQPATDAPAPGQPLPADFFGAAADRDAPQVYGTHLYGYSYDTRTWTSAGEMRRKPAATTPEPPAVVPPVRRSGGTT